MKNFQRRNLLNLFLTTAAAPWVCFADPPAGDTPPAAPVETPPPADAPPAETPPVDPEANLQAIRDAEDNPPADPPADPPSDDTPPADPPADPPAELTEEEKAAALEVENAEVPEAIEGYDFTIPEDIGLKDEKGEPFQFDKDDPFLKRFSETALAKKWDKGTVKDMIRLHAEMQKDTIDNASQLSADDRARRTEAEVSSLDVSKDGKVVLSGQDRIDSVLSSIEKVGGKDGVELRKSARAIMASADTVKVLEKLVGLVNEGDIGNKSTTSEDDLDGLSGEDALMKLRTRS